MQTKQIILSRSVPKTGQPVEVVSGDDGTYQAGWWRGLTVATNRTRFKLITVNSDIIVLDYATGLMWPSDSTGAGCKNGNDETWPDAITFCNNLDFAGFDDWRLPNAKELFSIVDFANRPYIDSDFFINITEASYWTSTSWLTSGDFAITVGFTNGGVDVGIKALEEYLIRPVRGGL